MKELNVLLPPISQQHHFAALVARHERLRAGQREALRQAEHLFQSLLRRDAILEVVKQKHLKLGTVTKVLTSQTIAKRGSSVGLKKT